MPYLRQRSLTGIPASASFKIATTWLSVMRLLIVKLLRFSLKEILRVGCIILRGSYIDKVLINRTTLPSDGLFCTILKNDILLLAFFPFNNVFKGNYGSSYHGFFCGKANMRK